MSGCYFERDRATYWVSEFGGKRCDPFVCLPQEELLNYEPKVLDCVERVLPDWSEEEKEEGMCKWRGAGAVARNPTGRTGIAGRGILPAFGANPAVVVVLILEENRHNHAPEMEEEVLRRVLLRSCPQRKYQLPWVWRVPFSIDHFTLTQVKLLNFAPHSAFSSTCASFYANTRENATKWSACRAYWSPICTRWRRKPLKSIQVKLSFTDWLLKISINARFVW